jgi:hypothetical protein
MANTEKPTSIRVPENILATIDSAAGKLGRSRAWVILRLLELAIVGERSIEDVLGRIGKVVPEKVRLPKKIADVSIGGVAQEVVGTPALPPLGKAQSEDNNWRHEVFRKGDNSDIILKPRGHGISTEALRIANLKDGVPCGHAGCLSHVSHACEGCGRIAGRRVGVLGDGTICDENPVELVVQWRKEFVEGMESVRQVITEVDKKIAEENTDGVKGRGKAGQDRGSAGGDSQPVAEGDHGAEEPAVGVGKPVISVEQATAWLESKTESKGKLLDGEFRRQINMQALRDICDGNIPTTLKAVQSDHTEVDLCGFKHYNEVDGEHYICGLEKHGPKVKHGDWIKI